MHAQVPAVDEAPTIGGFRGRRPWSLRIGQSRAVAAVVGAVILCALVRCIVVFGRTQFPGFDGSCSVNAGWQTSLGYRPYTDIVSGFPPIYLFGAALGMKIWGVTWAALVNTTALYAGLMFIAQALVFVRCRVSWLLAVVSSGLLQWITFVPISFWWYNQTAAAAGALFITAAMSFVLNPDSLFDCVVLAGATALLVLSKMNVAAAALGSAGLVLACLGPRRGQTLATLAWGVLAAVLILLLFRVNLAGMADCYLTAARGRSGATWLGTRRFPTTPDEWVEDEILLVGCLALGSRMLGRYRMRQFETILLASLFCLLAVTAFSFPSVYRLRGLKWGSMVEGLFVLALLAPTRFIRTGAAVIGVGGLMAAWARPFLHIWETRDVAVSAAVILAAIVCIICAVFLRARQLRGRNLALALLAACGAAISVAGYSTNREMPSGDAAALLASLILFLTRSNLTILPWQLRRGLLVCVVAAMVVAAGALTKFGAARWRVASAGSFYFYEDAPLTDVPDAFFRGTRVTPHLVEVNREVERNVRAIRSHHPDTTIYIGPRIEFEYACVNQAPPPGVPLVWEGFASERFQGSLKNNPPGVCIFLLNDRTFMPLTLVNWIEQNYSRREDGEIEIYTRR